MKIWITDDENYPVYWFSTEHDGIGAEAEIPAPLAKKWRRIEREYQAMQEDLAKLAGDR